MKSLSVVIIFLMFSGLAMETIHNATKVNVLETRVNQLEQQLSQY